MAIDGTRRAFLARFAGIVAAIASRSALPQPGAADATNIPWPDLLCSWEEDMLYRAGIWSPSRGLRGITLPSRAHGLVIDPLHPQYAIAVARRPGEYVVRFNAQNGDDIHFASADADRVFNGHGQFSLDGRALYTTENRTTDGGGVIGVRDAAALHKERELATHGIDPHAVLVEPSGNLLVANGGILTRPETGRVKLNPGHFDSSLVRIDPRDGRLLGKWRLPDHNLSIRHLAPSANGSCVGVALQAEHADENEREGAPLLALFDGESLRMALAPPDARLGGYGGDIACVALGGATYFAVSCTRAGRVALWDEDGKWMGAVPMTHACALTRYGDALVAAGEDGDLAYIQASHGRAVLTSATTLKWDNHIAVYGAASHAVDSVNWGDHG